MALFTVPNYKQNIIVGPDFNLRKPLQCSQHMAFTSYCSHARLNFFLEASARVATIYSRSIKEHFENKIITDFENEVGPRVLQNSAQQ